MNIRIKEPLYVHIDNNEYVVRPGTAGVEKNRVVFFHDVTRNAAVGFPRDCCLDNPQIFQVSRTLTDKEVSVKDVIRLVEDCSLPKDISENLIDKIRIL